MRRMFFRNGDGRAAFRGLAALVPMFTLSSCASREESPLAEAGARVATVAAKVVVVPVVATTAALAPFVGGRWVPPNGMVDKVEEVIDYAPPDTGTVSGPPAGTGVWRR